MKLNEPAWKKLEGPTPGNKRSMQLLAVCEALIALDSQLRRPGSLPARHQSGTAWRGYPPIRTEFRNKEKK